jgi:hypothetical protein
MLACVFWLCALAANATPQCATVHDHDRVALYGTPDDPDVLVWDSRFRLREYHAASFDEAKQLERHALLVRAGTRATVESCVPDFVMERLVNAPSDAVGIVIANGPSRGQRGWILGSDLRHI